MLNQEVEPMKEEGESVTAKEYLLQIKNKNREIRIQEEYIQRLIYSLGIAGIRYDKDRVQSSPEPDVFTKVFAQIDEEQEKLEEMKRSLVVTRIQIINQIHALNDTKYQDVLNYVYVDCKPLKKVANIMNFTYQYIKEVHGQALQEFEKNLPHLT